MGRVGLLLSYEREDLLGMCQLDFGGGDIATAHHYAPPGDDSYPLTGDFAVCVPGAGSGEWIAVGFFDPLISPSTQPGERMVYSRSAPGVMAASVRLKADGSVVINDKVEISASGDVSVLSLTADLEVTAGALIPLAKVTLSKHVHTAFGTPPTPGT